MEYRKDYDVTIPSAFYLQYCEPERTMKIAMDFRDKVPLLSHKEILLWAPPHDTEALSSAKKRQIMENIIYYLDHIRHFTFQVDGGELVESKIFNQATNP